MALILLCNENKMPKDTIFVFLCNILKDDQKQTINFKTTKKLSFNLELKSLKVT